MQNDRKLNSAFEELIEQYKNGRNKPGLIQKKGSNCKYVLPLA
jgi:uncharacterized protein YecT (DUF1311 family)